MSSTPGPSSTRGGRRIESITAFGRYFNFEASDHQRPWPSNGGLLTSVPRYANGPCSHAPAGTPCRFDTRAMIARPDGHLWESITAYGRYWNFDVTAKSEVPGSGRSLRSVFRYAQPGTGPCARAPEGQPCRFDTRTIKVKDGKRVEAITAYGRYYNFDLDKVHPDDPAQGKGAPWPTNDARLTSVARYRDACASTTGELCAFNTMTFFKRDTDTYMESLTVRY